MRNKKTSILVAALSISFILTSQSSFAQDVQVKSAEETKVESPKTDTKSTGSIDKVDGKSEADGSTKNGEEKSSSEGKKESSDKKTDDSLKAKIEKTEEKPAEDFHFSDAQKEELAKNGFSEEMIKSLEDEARAKKIEAEKDKKVFDVDKFIAEKIEANAGGLGLGEERVPNGVANPNPIKVDGVSSATYYKKANWENKIKDKSRWKVEDDQRLVRVTTSDPVEMTDINYDGNFVDGNGRTVLRLTYKEKGAAATAVWYRGLFNFGDLDEFIDYDKSYVVGVNVAGNENATYPLKQFKDGKDRIFDLGKARGDLTNQRKNLPINLVLKEGVTLKDLGQKNYIVQMRLTDANGKRIYAYAPNKTSMDYSTYTKTTSVSLEDKVNSLFIKGGYQKDGNNATVQSSFMSEFIANPKQYDDKSNLGIIRTQYTGQRSGNAASPTTGGQPIAFTQAFDAKLLKYLKADDKGNVAYVNVLENTRLKSKWSKNVGIKLTDFNLSPDGKLAYLVIGTKDFQKYGVKKVEIPQHDQYDMIQGYYITAIDYVVDKGKFDNTFAGKDELSGGKTSRKLNYSVISGWTNPNNDGWVVYEKEYPEGYKSQEGESYLIDTTSMPEGGQIMIKIGDEDAIIRKQQGNYSYYITNDKGIEKIEEYAKGVFKFTLREGATVKKGDKLKVYMPYTKDHKDPVNFLEINNGTKLNEGAATLTLQTDRNVNMHLYTDKPRGASFKLIYTLPNNETKELVFTKPKGLSTFWQFKDTDKVLTGIPNTSILNSGGNFYINTKKLKPGTDIIVESYDENGKKIEDQTSWLKYRPLDKSEERVKNLTWTDSSDTSSILSINKSLYTPYQQIFTNDYAEGNVYENPTKVPTKEEDFNNNTKEIVGYTKYDGGKIRLLYEGPGKNLLAKGEADSNEYDDKGNLTSDLSKKITIAKKDIFDPNFEGDKKQYTAYEYRLKLAEMTLYHETDKTPQKLELKKDMKFVSTASDGSSLASDLLETRVRTRILFDATEGAWMNGEKKSVKIAPDNVKFYGEAGYQANGFAGANVEANTGDEFPDNPNASGNKKFLGWVTAEGKKALQNKTTVSAEEFNKLTKEQIFTAETPITTHQVVYAVYSEDLFVTFDANGGNFGGKGQDIVKVENGIATKPTNPTKEGYDFVGWAETSGSETDDASLSDIKASKTVYAVWKKKAETPLTLTNPSPVEVKDLKGLTSDEIEKVKKAVAEANKDKGITEADITVDNDGTVTVKTADGKTATIAKENTVKQKEVKNEFNPPKEPVKVDKIGELKPEEVQDIKDAVKAANPDRNFKDDEITVNSDGSVSINQGGKVGKIPADKTVVQKDTILELKAPEKTEVKDTTDLSQAERDKVAEAVKAKNNLADGDKIEVDNKGNVTVTTADGTKTGTLAGKDTVKQFTREGKTLNPPANKVKVGNTDKLTEQEKQQVREEIKNANPELGFKDDEIQVDDNGTVTVPITDSKNGTFAPEKTIEAATDADKTIKLVAPEKTIVGDKTQLTQAEKDKVAAAVRKANPDLPEGAKITVSEDGAVTVTQGEGENQKVGVLSQADSVIEKLKAPETIVDVKNPVELTKEEKTAVEEAVKEANKNLPADAIITVNNDGSVTVTSGGKEIGKFTPDQTVKKAGEIVAPANPVEVKDPTNLTKEEKGAVEDAVKKANPTLPADAKVTVGNDGTVTVTDKDDKVLGTIPAEKAVKKAEEIKAPETPIKVDNAKALTAENKKAVEDAVKKANPNLPEGAKVEVADDGTVTVKDKDGKVLGTIPAEKTVKQDESKLGVKAPEAVEVANPNNVTPEEQGKIKEAVKKANPDLNLTDDDITVDDKGNVTVKKDGKEGKLTPAQTVKKAEEIKAPETPITVDNAKALTAENKKAVEDAVKKANPNLPEGAKIEVADDGTVTVTDKDGNPIGTIPADKAVKAALKAPEKPVEVKDPSKLTDEEKKAVEDAVKKANPDLPTDAKVTVGNDGTVTVTDKDGKEIGKLKPKATVKKATTSDNNNPTNPSENGDLSNKDLSDSLPGALGDANADSKDAKKDRKVNIPQDKVKVKNLAELTESEKKAVLDKVKKANPDAKEVAFDDMGNVALTFEDGFKANIPYRSLVAKAEDGAVAIPSKGKADAKNPNGGENPSRGHKESDQKPMRNRHENKGAKNVKTGVSEVGGLFGLLGTAIAGLFATKKKEDK